MNTNYKIWFAEVNIQSTAVR